MTVSQPPVPSPSMEVSTDSIESEKVGRPCRFGQNLPPAERIQPEDLASAGHTLERHPATETSDWREIRRQERGTAYRRSGILMLRP